MLEDVPADLLKELHRRHSEPQRHYHDWTHIDALLRHAQSVAELLHDTEAVRYAILFHDSIYDPKAKDNELRSAELLVESAPPIATASQELARRMIKATDGHALPGELVGEQQADCAHFLDMDLAILGADEARFDIYEDQIRREYAHVPDDAFRTGRAAVLRHFAEREVLYFSPWGVQRFEQAARANLARSLERLGA